MKSLQMNEWRALKGCRKVARLIWALARCALCLILGRCLTRSELILTETADCEDIEFLGHVGGFKNYVNFKVASGIL